HRLLLIFFHADAGLLDLFLGSGAGFIHGLGAGLGGLLATGFLVLEDFLAGFTQALLVVGGAGLGGGDIGARFFHGTLGAAAALDEHGGQRPMDEESIEDVKRGQKDDRGHGSEQ